MAHIFERLVVHCPTLEASEYLAAFVADHTQSDGSVRLSLRMPVSKLFDRRPMGERPVFGTFYPLKASADPFPTYSVSWLPKGDGVSPEFTGALAVEEAARADCFSLVLSGDCAAIAKAGGKRSAGRRIAQISPRVVLHAVAHYVENAYAHNKAALAGHSPLTHVHG
jgi:hypothetical protein